LAERCKKNKLADWQVIKVPIFFRGGLSINLIFTYGVTGGSSSLPLPSLTKL